MEKSQSVEGRCADYFVNQRFAGGKYLPFVLAGFVPVFVEGKITLSQILLDRPINRPSFFKTNTFSKQTFVRERIIFHFSSLLSHANYFLFFFFERERNFKRFQRGKGFNLCIGVQYYYYYYYFFFCDI